MSEEVAERAKEMGWVPKEEWKGDPEKWRPAEEFVSRGENVIPIMRDQIKKLETELKVAVQLNKQEIDQVRRESYEKATAEYKQKLAELDQLELQAFKSGDADTYMQVKQSRDALKAPAIPEATTEDPVFVEWKEQNPWYQSDKELADYTDFMSHKIVAEHGGNISKKALAEEMTKRTKAAFPHKFTNPKRNEPGAVEGGAPSAGGGGKKNTFESLPDSAKSAYRRFEEKFAAQGRKITKEQYAQAYYEG